MNLNSMLMGADSSVKSTASSSTGFKKPFKPVTMSLLKEFDTKTKPQDNNKVSNEETKTAGVSQIKQGIAKLFDNCDDTSKKASKGPKISSPGIGEKPSRSRINKLHTARSKIASGFGKRKKLKKEDSSNSNSDSDSDSNESSDSESSSSSSDNTKSSTKEMPISSKKVSKNPKPEGKKEKVPRKKVSNSYWKHFEIGKLKPMTTPQAQRRQTIVNSLTGSFRKEEIKNASSPLKKFTTTKKKQSGGLLRKPIVQMTPAQTMGHSRKLLQMKTIGVSNSITDSKSKEVDDIK